MKRKTPNNSAFSFACLRFSSIGNSFTLQYYYSSFQPAECLPYGKTLPIAAVQEWHKTTPVLPDCKAADTEFNILAVLDFFSLIIVFTFKVRKGKEGRVLEISHVFWSITSQNTQPSFMYTPRTINVSQHMALPEISSSMQQCLIISPGKKGSNVCEGINISCTHQR